MLISEGPKSWAGKEEEVHVVESPEEFQADRLHKATKHANAIRKHLDLLILQIKELLVELYK